MNTDSIKRAYEKFEESELWSGPSLYFHSMTISRLRQAQQEPGFSYLSLLQNESFLVFLYGTLVAWGLHRMGAKRRMIGFDRFRNELVPLAKLLDEIRPINFKNSTLDQIKNVKHKILSLFKMPTITEMSTKTQRENNRGPVLVANSKLLHHLHPDLLPPVDRQYIVRYFYCNCINVKQVYVPESTDRQTQWFWEILVEYIKLYDSEKKTIHELLTQGTTSMETSVTKVVDNIVVGHTLLNRDK